MRWKVLFCLFVCLFVCWSVGLLVCWFVCLFVCLFVCFGFVKIHAHFPHGCGTHFTVHTYLYTLAQGVKGCTRVESKLHVLTSGLSAVSDC